MAYTIEQVPVEASWQGRGMTPERATIELLSVGESFVVDRKRRKNAENAVQAVHRLKDGRRFATRTEPDGNTRIGRIK